MNTVWSRDIPNRQTRQYDSIPIHNVVPPAVNGVAWFQVVSHPFKADAAGYAWTTTRLAYVWCLPIPYVLSNGLRHLQSEDPIVADGSDYVFPTAPTPPPIIDPDTLPRVMENYMEDIRLRKVYLGSKTSNPDYPTWQGTPVPGQIIAASANPSGVLTAMGCANWTVVGTVVDTAGTQRCEFSTGGPASITAQVPFEVVGPESYVDGDTVVCFFADDKYRAIGGTCSET